MDTSNTQFILRALGVFSLILILPFPTAFYFLFRVIVFAGAIYAAIQIKNISSSRGDTIFFLMIAVAFIYNPIMMVFLYEKAIWIVVNICAALIFFNAASRFNKVEWTKVPRNYQTKASRNYQRNVSEKVQPHTQKSNAKNKQKNFKYDVIFFHTRIVKDQILHTVPRVINKKDQLVLGVIYLFFLIDSLREQYGYDVQLEKINPTKDTWFQPKTGNGFFINNLTVSVGTGPFFIHEVERIVIEKCLSSDKPNWLEEVKKRTESESAARYTWSDFQKSEFKNIRDYVTSLRGPYWGAENPLFNMYQDVELMKSAKQDLASIVKMAESRLASLKPSPQNIAIGMALGFTDVDPHQYELVDKNSFNQNENENKSTITENNHMKEFSEIDIPGTEDFENEILELRKKSEKV